MTMDSHDFHFEDSTHTYRNSSGIVRPSVTQLLKSCGIFDYSMVPPDVLENARRRGSNVHRWAEEFDRHGDIDETWIADDEMPYFQAWQKFRRDSGVIIIENEQRMMRTVFCVEIGGTPDRIALVGSRRFVLDIKCCRSKHPGWRLQTAAYELMLTGAPRCGHMGRMVIQLFPTGNYATIPHDDPQDANVVAAILQKTAAEESISAWMSNNNLKPAA